MLTVLTIVVAAVPFLVVFVLFAWIDRRRGLRGDVQVRQIALIDRIHERLGAVAAPVLRRRRDGWQVRIAVPFDRPTVTKALLAIVLESLALRDDHGHSLEIIVTRQPPVREAPRGAGGVRLESLPCT